MGKEKKLGILGFQTKDALKVENIKLLTDLKLHQSNYMEFKTHLEILKREYTVSKDSVPMVRYNLLKDMIKKVSEKKVIRKVSDAVETTLDVSGSHSGRKQKDVPDVSTKEQYVEPSNVPTGSKINGLLNRCKQFAGEAGDLEHKSKSQRDLNTMSKQEVAEDNEKKRGELLMLHNKFSKILQHLEILQKGYEDSKRLQFMKRYSKMKELVKLVITDSTL